MPATPAWPPGSLPRLFVEETLAEGAEIRVEGNAANYLTRVLRLHPGAQIKLFDDATGEWLAGLSHVGKRDALLAVEGKLREREEVPDLWLCFAPLKKGRIDWLAEKACELGVRRLVPVRTRRTVVDKVKPDRLRAHLIEAAEQCERTALPELAGLSHVGKRDTLLAVEAQLRDREEVPDLWLCFAPLKKGRIDWLAEKACELGVRRLVPVQTQRTIVDKVKPDRLRAHLIEAAEQCERTALPELAGLTKLETLLDDWPEDRTLFYAAERGGGSFRKALVENDGPAAILIGPEGGFTEEEDAAIGKLPQAVPVSLGPRILRADTAAVAAVSLWMAGRGDW